MKLKTCNTETRRVNGDGTFRFAGNTYQAYNWRFDISGHKDARRARGYRGDGMGRFVIGVEKDGLTVFLRKSDSLVRVADAELLEPFSPTKTVYIELDRQGVENPTPQFLQGVGQMVLEGLRGEGQSVVNIKKERRYAPVVLNKDGSTI